MGYGSGMRVRHGGSVIGGQSRRRRPDVAPGRPFRRRGLTTLRRHSLLVGFDAKIAYNSERLEHVVQLQNPLRSICPALEADILLALADAKPRTPGALVREGGVDASISGVRRCLERLEEGGLVDAARHGNRIEYQLNGRHMLAHLVVEASQAMDRFIRFVAGQISRWSDRPLQVTLFGSAARCEMHSDSDIDVLFIVPDGASEQMYEAISNLAVEAYRLTGNDVRPLVYEVSEVQHATVFESIVRDGLHIYGDRDWLSHRLSAMAVA